MSLTSGTKLGPYEIVSAIGAGGMGEVYRAHDSRLGRDVAIKVLPETFSADKERLARFEQEARAIATLNHPNIVAVYDIGEHDGGRYIVTELLEGETLRTKLSNGALPVRKAQEYALQVAQGLAAAHDKGIVHRDLKPENIIINKDGRAKILDFGLAKQRLEGLAAGATLTGVPQTTPGMTLGTIGYMSPEQVRGQSADHRSDIFSFGAVLHEMLSGERPFKRDTSAEVMTAILKDDPPEIPSSATRAIPPGIERIMRRCLEKDPEQRFQSARDLAFALEAMSGVGSTSLQQSIAARTKNLVISRNAALAGGVAALALLAIALYTIAKSGRSVPLEYLQLTASRGYIRMARFSPDGQSIVFGGMWNGSPMKLWTQRIDASGFSPLASPDADILSVSSTGNLAIALDRKFLATHVISGTLARTSFNGGEPRQIQEDILDADWSADGSDLAISRRVNGSFRLEYPIGKVLYETPGYISHMRFSHHGDKVAFMDHPVFGDDRGFVSVIDLKTNKRTVLTREYPSEDGIAWTPDDSELWFSCNDESNGIDYAIHGVNMSGKDRTVLRAPINVRVQDIAKDGTVLLIAESFRIDALFGESDTSKTRDLTWVDQTWGHILSNDAKWLSFSTQDVGSTTNYSVYLRKTDGSPATMLGEGAADCITPDNKWVFSELVGEDQSSLLLPLGAGAPQKLHSKKVHFEGGGTAFCLPDSKSFLVPGHEQGKASRMYLLDSSGEEPKPMTPDNVEGDALSADGKQLLAHDGQNKFAIYALDGGQPRPIPQIQPDEIPIQWLNDGRTVIVREAGTQNVKTHLLDINTGAKKPWKDFEPRDKVGLMGIYNVQVTPDGKHYLIAESHGFSSLFLVKGLK